MKKNEELLHSIGNIEDKYIEHAKPKERVKKNRIWISSVSAAACLIGAIGLTYYFVVRPINNISKDYDSSAEQTNSQVSSTPDISEADQTDTNDYPQNKSIELNYGGDNVKEINGVYFNGENIYMEVKETIGIVSIGMPTGNVSLPQLLRNCNGFEASDICYDDNYIYLLYYGTLYSISRSSNEIIAQTTNYFSPSLMHLGTMSKCIGVDNDGYMYIYSYNETENKNRILKYNCNLEIIDEYPVTSVQRFIPDHIYDFDSLYVEENHIICCTCGEKNLKIDIDTAVISSDSDVLKDDNYMYVEDENGKKSMITYFDREEHPKPFETTRNCIDSVVALSYEDRDVLSFKIFDKNGNTKMDQDEDYNLKKYRLPFEYKSFVKNGFVVDEKGYIQAQVQKENADGSADTVTINYDTVSGEFSENNAEVSLQSNKSSDGLRVQYHQSDGTDLCLSEGTLYSIDKNNAVDDNIVENEDGRKIFDLPETISGYDEEDINLLKIDDNSYMFVVTGGISKAGMYRLTKE